MGVLVPVSVDTLVLDDEHFPTDQFAVGEPGEDCDGEHWRSDEPVRSVEGGLLDAAPDGCGYGLVGFVPEATATVPDVQVVPARDRYRRGEQVTVTVPETFWLDGYDHVFAGAWDVDPASVPHDADGPVLTLEMTDDVAVTTFYESFTTEP